MNAFNAPQAGRISSAVICRSFLGFVLDSSRSYAKLIIAVRFMSFVLYQAEQIVTESGESWKGFFNRLNTASPCHARGVTPIQGLGM